MAQLSDSLAPVLLSCTRPDSGPMPSAIFGGWKPVLDVIPSRGMKGRVHRFAVGYYFPAGRKAVLLEARVAAGSAGALASLDSIADRVGVDICYCSLYGSDCDDAKVAVRDLSTPPCGP